MVGAIGRARGLNEIYLFVGNECNVGCVTTDRDCYALIFIFILMLLIIQSVDCLVFLSKATTENRVTKTSIQSSICYFQRIKSIFNSDRQHSVS